MAKQKHKKGASPKKARVLRDNLSQGKDDEIYHLLLFNIYIKHVDSTSPYSVRKESGLNETGKDRLAVTATGCSEENMMVLKNEGKIRSKD